MSTYGNQNFNNPPYGTPAWHEQQRRLKNAHKSPDPVLAQQQIAAAQPPALSAANPLPATAIPPGSQVNPRQGPAPWQSFKDSAAGVLEQLNSVPNDRPSQYGPQPPVEAAPSHTTGPGILARPQPERYVPAPVEENRGMDPMTPEESAAFRLTPAGQRIYGSVPGGEMGDQTGGRRDSTTLAAAKKTQHVSFGEAMGRYGGAIMNAGSQGGMAQVGAMGTVTGEIADIEREQENLRLQEQAKQQEAYQKSIAEQQAGLNEMNQLDSRFSQALAKFELYDNVTGITPVDGFSRVTDWAGMNDSSRQAFRLELKQIIVDETLLSTAKTKGAVSDKEMALFASGIPTMNDDEETWKAWLNQRRSWIAHINNRISTGTQVSSDAEVGFPGYSAPETSQKQYSAEEDDALFNF
jgi:hypothetical protein